MSIVFALSAFIIIVVGVIWAVRAYKDHNRGRPMYRVDRF